MKLRTLKIGKFKNLQDFVIDFGANPLTTVLLGQNGTGKSNLLEALILIFRDLDLGEISPFPYILNYECRGREIQVDSDPTRGKKRSERVKITVQEAGDEPVAVPYNEHFYKDNERRYLPSYVFGYYSGPSNRMEQHFDKHQVRFYKALLDGKELPLRPLLYARLVHSQFALLSFFNTEDQGILKFLQRHMGIEGLSSVLFILHKPSWGNKEKASALNFWHATGVVKDFLNKLYQLALAPMHLGVRVEPEFAKGTTLEHLYLYLPGVEKLQALAKHYANTQEFFKALESTYISKMLSEVRIALQVRNSDGSLTFRDLSEGEQQLLMVLGLLRFTKEDEALFLLDEPDTHLNPTWSIQYLEFMREVVDNPQSSHVILTTHNPLVISGLQKEDVRIMQRRKTGIFVEQPRENPQGMGVSNILTSEMFGLRSTLDWATQQKLDRQRVLSVNPQRTPQEDIEWLRLTQELDDMGFQVGEDDELYSAFIKKWFAREEPDLREQLVLTPEQQRGREQMMEEIVKELMAEGHWI